MFDPDHILNSPGLRREQLLLEAAWRYQLVAPLLGGLDEEAKSRVRRRLSTEKQVHPFRGEVSLSPRTIRRWCQAYREKQLDGLWLQPRVDLGTSRSIPEGALERAKLLFRKTRGARFPLCYVC